MKFGRDAALSSARHRFRRGALWLAKVGVVAIPLAACAVSSDPLDVGSGFADAGPPILILPGDDGSTGEASMSATPMCVVTECPDPYASCPPSASGTIYFPCEVNLLSDDQNCGECGHVCPPFSQLAAVTHCVNGQCDVSCDPASGRRDCNGIPDDACEANTETDRKNCGACGNACTDGVVCIEGKCGCKTGELYCDGHCIDPMKDPHHCGSCGNECRVPADAEMPRPELHMVYTCVDGLCGKLACDGYWTDCNGDRHLWQTPLSDGCEVDLGVADPNNCGACGHTCDPDQRCRVVSRENGEQPQFECVCKGNETKCGEQVGLGDDNFYCANLLTDRVNCGACGHVCPAPERGQAQCRQGVCQFECEAGRADCNDIEDDGCETNLFADPTNCGACGNRCDTASGQPCVEGRCLVEACIEDAGVTR